MITRDTVKDQFAAPIAPYVQGTLPVRVIEGPVLRSAWRVDVADLTPLQLIAPLRAQLDAEGFRVVLDCEAQVCGGYDFRFETEVLPAPNMYVNLRSYHALTALRGPQEAPEQAVTIIASASSGASFIQIIQAGVVAEDSAVQAVASVPQAAAPDTANPAETGSVAQALSRDGNAVLAALDFESGTSDLAQGPFDVLAELAETMRARPDMRIALVGHTDNVGSLDGNIALSVSRARSVRQRMIEVYGIAPARLQSQGMGFLAPYTSNTTEEGREANRRVEAVVLAE
ncbi:OmpA family protein [Sulfitobacter sp.]|uniref:OmpA family protein n=1 Tax=Sulfitobacter sp. TaxID=1903071 RepID=UPI0030033B27